MSIINVLESDAHTPKLAPMSGSRYVFLLLACAVLFLAANLFWIFLCTYLPDGIANTVLFSGFGVIFAASVGYATWITVRWIRTGVLLKKSATESRRRFGLSKRTWA